MEKNNLKLYEKKQIPMLVVVIGLLVMALAWSYWVMPLWDEVRAAILNNEKVVSELDAKNLELNAMKKFKIYLTNEGDKVALMDEVLPKKDEMDNTLVQIERMAVDNKLFVNSITVSNEKTDKEKNLEIKNADRVKLSMQLDGEYPNLVNFVDNLQNSTRLVLVDKVSVVSNVDVENQSVLYTLEMNLLFQK
ncbi:MAG TPA: type 4a pilus biogenesis protein PilO [bacterium]|nr:type 4a pilus biogenesis protein PilO [bacterium]